VIAVSRELRPDLGGSATELGADAVVSLGVSAEQLVSVIESALAGDLRSNRQVQRAEAATRLGFEAELSLRESEVLGLVVRGLSNHDIADTCCLSINTVKSYIRSAYRKIDVTSRTQAVAWGVQHGYAMDVPASGSR